MSLSIIYLIGKWRGMDSRAEWIEIWLLMTEKVESLLLAKHSNEKYAAGRWIFQVTEFVQPTGKSSKISITSSWWLLPADKVLKNSRRLLISRFLWVSFSTFWIVTMVEWWFLKFQLSTWSTLFQLQIYEILKDFWIVFGFPSGLAGLLRW